MAGLSWLPWPRTIKRKNGQYWDREKIGQHQKKDTLEPKKVRIAFALLLLLLLFSLHLFFYDFKGIKTKEKTKIKKNQSPDPAILGRIRTRDPDPDHFQVRLRIRFYGSTVRLASKARISFTDFYILNGLI